MEVTPTFLTFAYVGLTQALTVNVLGTAKDKSIISITSVADSTVKKTVPVEVKGQVINNGGGTGNPIPSNGNGSTAVRLIRKN